jgi:hypothetical protein
VTKKEAVKLFNELNPRDTFVTPSMHGDIEKMTLDKVARDQAWNNFTDSLCKGGRITLHQYETWTSPW